MCWQIDICDLFQLFGIATGYMLASYETMLWFWLANFLDFFSIFTFYFIVKKKEFNLSGCVSIKTISVMRTVIYITTYETVKKNPFGRVERELNSKLLSLKKEGKLDDRTYNRLHLTDGLPPTIRRSVKHHKEGYPLWPIINAIGSSLYNTSKYLTTILSPIQNNSVKNSTEFAREIKNIKIDDDEVMVSFDVVSLFTAIPIPKTCQYRHTKLEQDDTLTSHTNLTIDNIISLLDFTLSNNYFIYNNVTYKQIHGCAMGSPVSPVVANLCMDVIENTAIHTTLTIGTE